MLPHAQVEPPFAVVYVNTDPDALPAVIVTVTAPAGYEPETLVVTVEYLPTNVAFN